jgi:hypothetical protein
MFSEREHENPYRGHGVARLWALGQDVEVWLQAS